MSRMVRGNTSCDYCGLPLATGARRQLVEEQEGSRGLDPLYCCYGCLLAARISASHGEEGASRWLLIRLGLAIFFSLNVMVFTMALWSVDVYPESISQASASSRVLAELLRWLCLLFSAPVVALLGLPLAENALSNLRRGVLTIDVMLLLAVVASLAYSVLSMVSGGRHVYFEVGCVVLVAVTLGRWLEAVAKQRTTAALRALENLLPQHARRVAGNDQEQVPLEQLRRGQTIRVLAGERIPLDGRLTAGSGYVDEQVLTGESQPVLKQTGDAVLAGSLNVDGDLRVEITAEQHQTALQQLVDSVCRAAMDKGPQWRLADRLTAWFLPAVMLIALTTLIIHAWSHDWLTAIMCGLSVLLIACPCAVGTAAPLAIWAGLGRAARQQVVFQRGDALEKLANVTTICFDKTGTLTTGQVEVTRFVGLPGENRDQVLATAATVCRASIHPLAAAVVRFVGRTEDSLGAEQVRTLAGRGLVGQLLPDQQRIYVGSQRLMEEAQLRCEPCLIETLATAAEGGFPVACVGWSGRVRGLFVFREQLRDNVVEVLESLRCQGLSLKVLTGDRSNAATAMMQAMPVECLAGLLPHDKLAAIHAAKQAGGPVAMVGDGINDAPALAAADVGIALGCAADVARQTADVCLLGNDLGKLLWAIELSRRTIRTIRQNFCWAFAYNGIGVTLAAAGWLNPIVASLAMIGSSAIVIGNSYRLGGEAMAAAGTIEPSGAWEPHRPPMARLEPASSEPGMQQWQRAGSV